MRLGTAGFSVLGKESHVLESAHRGSVMYTVAFFPRNRQRRGNGMVGMDSLFSGADGDP